MKHVMEFSRIGEHTIKCVISEEEIYDLGYTMDEIMSNGERTQEFMNKEEALLRNSAK